MMTLTINQELKGIEVSFDSKPEQATLNTLKANGFRWHNVKKIWYAKQTDERMAIVQAIANGEPITTSAAPKTEKADFKAMLTEQFKKVWSNEKMVTYCVNNTATIAKLPNGEIITVEKQGIETRFCFGESGYDYDDALQMAHHARTSEEYFKDENMASFRKWVEELEECKKLDRSALVIYQKHYTGQTEDCKLASIQIVRMGEVIEACGGCVRLDELPGKEISLWCRDCRIATNEEINLILEAYKEAAKAHEKKVDSYLKRYGTSKVHSWTYWREA